MQSSLLCSEGDTVQAAEQPTIESRDEWNSVYTGLTGAARYSSMR